MKIKITLELEFADIPEHERAEIEADMDWDNGEEEPLPRLADYSERELQSEATEALLGMFNGDYSDQAELWAGSSFYAWIKSAVVVPAPDAKTRLRGLPVDEATEKNGESGD